MKRKRITTDSYEPPKWLVKPQKNDKIIKFMKKNVEKNKESKKFLKHF